MGNLAGMEQWAGNMDVSERDKYLQNLLNFYQMKSGTAQTNADKMGQYQKDLWKYNAEEYYGRMGGKSYYNPLTPFKSPGKIWR